MKEKFITRERERESTRKKIMKESDLLILFLIKADKTLIKRRLKLLDIRLVIRLFCKFKYDSIYVEI